MAHSSLELEPCDFRAAAKKEYNTGSPRETVAMPGHELGAEERVSIQAICHKWYKLYRMALEF
jgi:hypothetical protein